MFQKIQSSIGIPPWPSTSNTLSRFKSCFNITSKSYKASFWRFTFCSLNLSYSTNQGLDNAVPVLLVDGYNVCGYWMKLKKHFMKGRLDIARQKLIDELVTFSMLRGLYISFFCWHKGIYFVFLMCYAPHINIIG